MKSDRSIRNICIAAIKRRSSNPHGFSSTKFFEKETIGEIYANPNELPDTTPNELPIVKTTMDEKNWTLVTTRHIITSVDGIINSTKAYKVLTFDLNDFKGYESPDFTIGCLHLDDERTLDVFIETGKASMVTIYAIKSLLGQEKPPPKK